MIQTIFFALISYLGWGIGDVFGTSATRKLGSFSISFWSAIFSIILISLYVPFASGDLARITADMCLLSFALGAFGVAGILSFNEGLRVGNAPLVGTIAASFSALVVVFSMIFLGERLTPAQAVAIIIVFLGLLLSTLDLKGIKNKEEKLVNRGVFWAVVAMVTWGIWFTFIKIPVQRMGWFWPTYLAWLAALSLLLLLRNFRGVKLKSPNFKNAFLPLLSAVVLLRVAEFSYNIAISKGLVVIVAPIAGSYPTLFAVLAHLVFKDPITKQQVFGIIITLIGIVLLSVFSV